MVNLILDTRLNGIKASAEYGQSKYGDGKDYTASLAMGKDFLGGKAHITIAGEYEDSEAVDGCYSRPWCAQEHQALTNSTPGVNGLPAQVITTNVHTSTMSRGGLITSGPLKGTAFNADGSTFAWNYGQLAGTLFQIGGSGAGQNAYITGVDIKVPVKRYSTFLHGDYDLTDNIRLFAEGSYSVVDGRNLGGATRDTGAITIQSDNAFLPASMRAQLAAAKVANFKFGREGVDLGFLQGRDLTKTARFATGAKGDLGGGWSWDAYYQYGHADFTQTIANDRNNIAFNLAVDAVTNPANGCQPINLFGQNQFSPAAKAYTYGTAIQTLDITEHVLAANLRGEPFRTWAGPVSIAMGGEYRHERGLGDADAVSKALAWQSGNGSAIDGTIGVVEGYAETVVPLAKDMPFAKSLEFNAAVRGTHYTTSGSVLTWKVGGVWDMTDWLKLRATRSRDVRAPNFNELFSPQVLTGNTINDQQTKSQGVINVIKSGNPNLTPEKADTLTAGVVLQPKWGWSRGLRVSVDYYKIEVAGAIATEVPQNIVTQCFQGVTFYCSYIDRGPDGVITLIHAPYLNLNSLMTDGFDIEGQYTLPLQNFSHSLPGALNFSFLATYVKHLISKQSTGSLDIAGVTGCAVTSTFLCVPHWTLDATLGYDVGPLSVNVRAHYIPKSVYDPTLIGPEDPGYSPFLSNSISSNRVASAIYWNLGASYNFINSDRHRLQLFGGIDNLFDKNPPANQPGRGNNVFFDPVGRYFKVGVRLSY